MNQGPFSALGGRLGALFRFRSSLLLIGILTLLAVSTAGFRAPFAFASDSDRVRITAVYDGDTVKVKFSGGNERKVRLIGIDTPEMDDEREAVRFMAGEAKRVAFLKLFGKMARLSYDWQREDKYGRVLAYLTTDEGFLFNEWLVREGFASVLRSIPFDKDRMKTFDEAEREARKAGKGLWKKGPYPLIPPSKIGELAGFIVSVRFLCSRVEKRKAFTALISQGGEIEILIPKASKESFPDLEVCAKKVVIVTGLVEKDRGGFQILLFVPMQLKIE